MIRLSLQKSGRLTEKTLELLKGCGLDFRWSKNKLVGTDVNFPLEVLMVRDDDIPNLVHSGVSDLGVVGENVLKEASLAKDLSCPVLRPLGFGQCRLSMAIPNEMTWQGPTTLQGLRISTSYPKIVEDYLRRNDVSAEVVEISGSVELSPALNIADVVCDIVSTGSTLRANGLKETETIIQSQSVIIQNPKLQDSERLAQVDRLLNRIDGVLKARNNKYVMMNAPRTALSAIKEILPGMENPSIMSLDEDSEKIAIHAVCDEKLFWNTMEKLKAAGATSVLVVPIEKVI